MNTPVAGTTTTRYPVTGTPLTTTQTTASNSGYPPHAYAKLGVNDRAAAVAVANTRGYLPLRTDPQR